MEPREPESKGRLGLLEDLLPVSPTFKRSREVAIECVDPSHRTLVHWIQGIKRSRSFSQATCAVEVHSTSRQLERKHHCRVRIVRIQIRCLPQVANGTFWISTLVEH